MTNNDRLIRLRYALDIKNTDMIEIFALGGMEVTKEEVLKMLTKVKESYDSETDEWITEGEELSDSILETFLNGFITFKRGKQEPKPGQPERPALSHEPVNNLLLKKLKIALSLTTEDMLETFDVGGIIVSKGELGALLRKQGHKNYKVCGDNFARRFLQGLTVQHRE
jgi:uncharacterized protein YehS (DUF1456 family)